MRASGNGDVSVCANNLLRTFRGEVPYERVKGLDPRNIDRPLEDAELDIQQDAEWLLENYEPRAVVEGVSVEPSDEVNGGFAVLAKIKERES